jgi:hypothetical protein
MMSAIHRPDLIGCVMKEKTMMMNVTFVVMVLELGTQKKNLDNKLYSSSWFYKLFNKKKNQPQ